MGRKQQDVLNFCGKCQKILHLKKTADLLSIEILSMKLYSFSPLSYIRLYNTLRSLKQRCCKHAKPKISVEKKEKCGLVPTERKYCSIIIKSFSFLRVGKLVKEINCNTKQKVLKIFQDSYYFPSLSHSSLASQGKYVLLYKRM